MLNNYNNLILLQVLNQHTTLVMRLQFHGQILMQISQLTLNDGILLVQPGLKLQH